MMYSLRRILAAVLILAVSGCATGEPAVTTPLHPSGATLGAAQNDAITIVFLHKFTLGEPTVSTIADEDRVVQCVTDAIHGEIPTQRVISFDEFRRIAFPDLPPEAAPRRPEYLRYMLADPTFGERMESLQLRYLLFVGGTTEIEQVASYVQCGGYGPGAHCVGYWQWEKTSHIAASLLDVRGIADAQEFETTQVGTAWLVVVQIFPIGVPAVTEFEACTDIGRRVGHYLAETRTAR